MFVGVDSNEQQGFKLSAIIFTRPEYNFSILIFPDAYLNLFKQFSFDFKRTKWSTIVNQFLKEREPPKLQLFLVFCHISAYYHHLISYIFIVKFILFISIFWIIPKRPILSQKLYHFAIYINTQTVCPIICCILKDKIYMWIYGKATHFAIAFNSILHNIEDSARVAGPDACLNQAHTFILLHNTRF